MVYPNIRLYKNRIYLYSKKNVKLVLDFEAQKPPKFYFI
jgi:hypothetical protein